MLKRLFNHLVSLFQQSEPEPKAERTPKKRKPQKRLLSPETDGNQGLLCYIRYQVDGQDDLVTVFVSREPTRDEALALARRHNREVFGNLRTGEIVITDVFCVSDDDLKVE